MTTLKPCPFCGGTDVIASMFTSYCNNCGASGPDAARKRGTPKQLKQANADAWNTRATQYADTGLCDTDQFIKLIESERNISMVDFWIAELLISLGQSDVVRAWIDIKKRNNAQE